MVTAFLAEVDAPATAAYAVRRVLLFQRAPTMPTYAGAWAGVSGSVEPSDRSALAAAYREIAEETGLRRGEHLRLLRSGLHLDVDDAQRGRYFRVYPFLFAISAHAAASSLPLCSEHARAALVPPAEMARRDTVPRLYEVYRRVAAPLSLFPAHQAALREEARRRVAEDCAHGAAEVAVAAAELVANGADADAVAALRPTFAPVVNIARAVQREPGMDARAALRDAFDAAVRHAAAAALQRVRAHESATAPAVATLSWSSSALAVLRAVLPTCRVLVSRSEPGGEGERTATALRESLSEHIAARGDERGDALVQLLDDDDLVDVVRRGGVCAVLSGADAIVWPRGDVINKVGTRRLFEAAGEAGTPTLVVADAWKRWHDDLPPPLEEPLFELVDARLVSQLCMG